MTPLKAHSRNHPYPRPAGNHYIRNRARMNLTNNGVRRRLRAQRLVQQSTSERIAAAAA
jgi:hypothetical protein